MGGSGSGPQPKPTALKRLEGSWRVNEREPAAPVGLPPRPVPLGRAGLREWKTLGPVLVRMGVLTEVDGTAFATYCRLVDQAASVRRRMSNAPDGRLSSLEKQERDIAKALHPYLALFGLTPATRSKIVAAPVTKARSDNPWAA